jgi:hypothetical protein
MSLGNLNEYYLEYQKYKEGKYQFGNYSTKEQIVDEFYKNKRFVLKGGLGVGMWILTILMFVISSISLYALFLPDPELGIFIIPFIFTFPTGLISLLSHRKFLVIGPLGVSYRKILSSGIFSWNDVNNITHFTQKFKGFTTGVVVKISISYGRKIRFGSSLYLNKEFRRKFKKELFLALFYIYSQLGKKKISPSYYQKSVSYSQMKESLQSSIKMREILEKGKKILEEIMKNDEEYKILLARKAEGESVEELIKRNRNKSDVLVKRDKEQSAEALSWGRSEEGQKFFNFMEETRRLNPRLAREDNIKYAQGLKIAKEIEKNEKEYEKLLERKSKGEYVDDLIKQNRYTAKVLAEQNKKGWD